MHTNEAFLTKLTAEQIDELKELAQTFGTMHSKALDEQIARLNLSKPMLNT